MGASRWPAACSVLAACCRATGPVQRIRNKPRTAAHYSNGTLCCVVCCCRRLKDKISSLEKQLAVADELKVREAVCVGGEGG